MDSEAEELLTSKALREFCADEYRFLAALIGARNVMTDQQWAVFKTNGGLDPAEYLPGEFDGVGSFRGVYTLLEDITKRDLEYLYSCRSVVECEA